MENGKNLEWKSFFGMCVSITNRLEVVQGGEQLGVVL